jgi:hypothetical protein
VTDRDIKPGNAGTVHVMPRFPGEREHEESLRCWCRPRRDSEQPHLIVHERRAET